MTQALGKLGLAIVGAIGLAMLYAMPISSLPPNESLQTSDASSQRESRLDANPQTLTSVPSRSSNSFGSISVDSISLGPLSVSTAKLGPGLASLLLLLLGLWPVLKMVFHQKDAPASNANNNEANPVASNASKLDSNNETGVETNTLTTLESSSSQAMQATFNVGVSSQGDLTSSRFDHTRILEAYSKGYEQGAEVSLHTVLVDSVNKSNANVRSVSNEFKEEAHATVFKLGKRDQLLATCENLRDEADFYWLIQATVDYEGCFKEFVDCTNAGSDGLERLLRQLRQMIRDYPTGADVSGTIEQQFKELYREIANELNRFEQKLDAIENKARNKKSCEYVLRQTKKAFSELTQIEGKIQ